MIDMAQADRTLRAKGDGNDKVFENFRTRLRGTNDQEYQIYLACADDGNGGDITRGGAPLKTYQEWLMS
jgi:hypothetical protein